jgi:putative ABC transport system permease protein
MLEICLDSIAHRLMRSAVTVAIILLAIAFLAYVMVEGYVGRETRDAVLRTTERMTAYTRFLKTASQVAPDAKLIAAFAALREGSADWENMAAWGKLTPDAARQFVAQSVAASSDVAFFEALPPGRRVLLVEDHEGLAVFDWLCETKNRDAFLQRIAAMKSLRIPGGTQAFVEFVQTWPSYRDAYRAIRLGYEDTLRQIAAYAGPDGIGARLQAAAAEGKEAEFFTRLAAAGLRFDPRMVADTRDGLAHHARVERAFAQLRKQPIKTGWNREFQEKFNPGEALAVCTDSPRRIAWIQGRLQQAGLDADFHADEFLATAREHRFWQSTMAKAQSLVRRYGAGTGLSSKVIWLICVSFLVCVVGIANAMLMSVLERFKEIATMKCLGARNGTIAFLFVTESTIMGAIGGLAGMLAGFAIAYARLGIQYGAFAVAQFPAAEIGRTLLVCFCASLVLAMVAAIYPARVASRMAPMEAMRVD